MFGIETGGSIEKMQQPEWGLNIYIFTAWMFTYLLKTTSQSNPLYCVDVFLTLLK